MRMNETKLKIIKNWFQLQTMHNVRFFLKLCVYYRRFIENFVIITNFFYELIREFENKKFKIIVMIFVFKNAFYNIKNVMCNNRVLIQFDIFLFFIIEIDVFDFDWKIVLYQIKFNNKKHFIVFESKTFLSIEKNYVIHERKLLIIKKSFRK